MATRDTDYPYEIEFYEDPSTGRQPVLVWMRGLDEYRRAAIGTALRHVLQRKGLEACAGEWGKLLGAGLFEFRVRHSAGEVISMFTRRAPREDPKQGEVLLRVFGHAHGNKLLLLLNAYDKGDDSSRRRQDQEIALARKRLREYRLRTGS